jgi:nucleoside-diphosphate-sugar epimerase
VFVSAAEAKWDFKAPVPWLEEYLVAKRAVEKRLTQLNSENKLRASWLRPSLVYTFDKPAALPAVAAFTIGNLIGLPFVDKPVTVDTLAKAAVRAIGDGATSGVLDWKEMERLAGE